MKETNGIQLVDRSIHLARAGAARHLWIYYASTAPFLLYFLYFFNDMSAHPFAAERLGISSGILALLFVLMKFGHSVFGLCAYDSLLESNPRKLPFTRFLKGLLWQTMLGAAGLIVIPISLVFMIPFGWCYAFFQNATVGQLFFENGTIRDALFHSSYGQRQNHLMLWIVCPISLFVMCCTMIAMVPLIHHFGDAASFTAVIAVCAGTLFLMTLASNPFGGLLFINCAAVMVALPRLLEMLFGWETAYSMSFQTFMHPGFILTVWALCFLLMDPIVKLCYLVRIYDQNALRSGHDLLKKSVLAAPIIVCCVLSLPTTTAAAPSRVDQTALDKTIGEVLQKPAYVWRDQRSLSLPEHEKKKPGIINRFFTSVKKTVDKIAHRIVRIVKKLFKKNPKARPVKKPILPFLFDPRSIMIAGLLVIAALACFVFIQRSKRRVPPAIEANTAHNEPETGLSVVSPADHTHDKWEKMAGHSLASGDTRAAVRFFFLSTLSLLGERRILSLRTSRSNREHRRELLRRFPDKDELNGSFFSVIANFESAWYGSTTPTPASVEKVIASHTLIKEFVYHHA